LRAKVSTYNALIFARYNSSRLPGKVLFALGDQTIIGICVNKLRHMKFIRPIVATSDQESDDPIAKWCVANNVECFRGSLNNVARRAADCLRLFPSDAFFRINADSPFMFPELLEEAVNRFERRTLDVVSNVVERSYPYGIAVELINSTTFLKQIRNFSTEETEHITTYFYRNREEFSIEIIKNAVDLSGYRFVLDTNEDWTRIKELFNNNSDIFDKSLNELIKIN
jgi:spore coat polysaccharide biosynthesis protein SpsF